MPVSLMAGKWSTRFTSLVLLAAALVVMLSETHAAALPAAVVSVLAGTGLALWLNRRCTGSLFFDSLAFLAAWTAWTAAAASQAVTAAGLPASGALQLNLHRLPLVAEVTFLLAGLSAFLGISLVLRQGTTGSFWAALLGAGLWGSSLFLRAFVVREAGPIFGAAAAFLLLAWMRGAGPVFLWKPHDQARHFWRWSLFYLAAVLAAALVSPTPGESLEYWARMAVTVALSAALAAGLTRQPGMQTRVVGVVLILAGVVSVLWGAGKLLSLAQVVEWQSAISYRLHPTELGGGNLIARLVLSAVPLALALWWLPVSARWRLLFKGGLVLLATGMVWVVFQSLAWGGRFALAAALLAFILLGNWERILTPVRRMLAPRLARAAAAAVLLGLSISLVLAIYQYAPTANIYSFNTRLIHWQGALLAWKDHFLLGGGPGNRAIYTIYTGAVQVFKINQQLLDDPLYVARLTKVLNLHSHNLLLEIASTSGTAGLVAFMGMLISLVRLGFDRLRQPAGFQRWIAAACLAGIAGELAWGMLDVLWVMPPFFSFPVWVLVGLLVASPQAPPDPARTVHRQLPGWGGLVFGALAAGVVLLPALAANRYAAGFLAFQEQRWVDARGALQQSAWLAPLDPKVRDLLAQAHINLGEWDRAEQVYRQAALLKKDYSPYLYRLGWLAWRAGDRAASFEEFQRAINADPSEIWQRNLYTSAALALVGDGSLAQAGDYFVKSALTSPSSEPSAAWVNAPGASSASDLVLDPVYARSLPDPALEQRIDAWLGVANLTPRQFTPVESGGDPLSYRQVLQSLRAVSDQSEDADPFYSSLVLAQIVDISLRSGYVATAQAAALDFQRLNPRSSFGYQEMSKYRLNQGQLDEAQDLLNRAVEISPKSVLLQYRQALIAISRKDWDAALEQLTRVTRSSQSDPYEWHLNDTDLNLAWSAYLQARQEESSARDVLRTITFIRGTSADYLALADIERRLGRDREADSACLEAARIAVNSWTRPWNGLLLEIATCASQSPDSLGFEKRLRESTRQAPFLEQIIVGHLYRTIAQPEDALRAYQRAAQMRPDEGAAAFFIAETYRQLNLAAEAEASYRTAALLDPYESLPLLQLGRMQKGEGSSQLALDTFKQAAQVTPGWDEAQMELANLLMEMKDPEAASEHFRLAQDVQIQNREPVWQNLLSTLLDARVEQSTDFIHGDYFTIDQKRYPVLFMHPDSQAVYSLRLPADAPLMFTAQAGMSPGSWKQPGDGVNFVVSITTRQEPKKILYEVYVDPKNRPDDRRWFPIRVDLSAYAGLAVELELSTRQAGDDAFDWAGWGVPIVVESAQPGRN